MSKQHTSVRSYGVLIDAGRVALVRSSNPRHDPPLWWLPGCGIDFGEAPEDTLVREFHEETGLSVQRPRLLGVTSDVRRRDNGYRIHTVRILFTVELEGGELHHAGEVAVGEDQADAEHRNHQVEQRRDDDGVEHVDPDEQDRGIAGRVDARIEGHERRGRGSHDDLDDSRAARRWRQSVCFARAREGDVHGRR